MDRARRHFVRRIKASKFVKSPSEDSMAPWKTNILRNKGWDYVGSKNRWVRGNRRVKPTR